MADLEPVIAEADWRALAGAVDRARPAARRWSCCSPPLEPSAVEEGLLPVLPALTRHHRVVLASVRDPALERLAAGRGDLDEVYDAAAAEQVLADRRRTADAARAPSASTWSTPTPSGCRRRWPTTTWRSRRRGLL